MSVGPFAYLRPGTVLREGAKIGHVRGGQELGHRQRARKSPTSSYIGDADVGEQSNLGAATITANYDGRAKHRTKIGTPREGRAWTRRWWRR